MDAPQGLNFFQRMMLRWRDLQPYNPVHVLRLPIALDAARLREAIAAQLQAQGLSALDVDRRRWRCRWAGGPAEVRLRIVDADGDAEAALARVIEEEFNRPFVPGPRENPLRFVAIDEHGAYRLALVYDHYVAGGEAIARLLSALGRALLQPGAPPQPLQPAQRAARYRSVLLRHPGWVLRALLGLPRMVAQARRACRVTCRPIDDSRNAYRGLRLGGAQTRALRARAADWGVTLNELLTACLMLALSPQSARRHAHPRRRELAVASIMDMRRDLPSRARDGLAPFLAAFRVAHRVPDGIALRELCDDVHRQVQRVKRGHLYLQSLMGLALSALVWPLLGAAQRQGLYLKHFPVQAGITAIDLNRVWDACGVEPPQRLDYLRAVPTGPLCPLVLAVTSVHDELHLGIAFRTCAYSREAVEQLAAELLRAAELAAPALPS